VGWLGRNSTGVRRRGALAVLAVALAVPATTAQAVGAAPTDGTTDTTDTADTAGGPSGSAVPAFLYRSGRYRPFEAPAAGVALYPSGINDHGEVTGEYIRDDGESGFVRRRNGRISTFDVPGARGTKASKINDHGQIVGRYSEDTPLVDDSRRVRGYVRWHGRTTRIDFPGASHTLPTGINDRGDVVGYYVDDRNRTHGFVWRNRRFTTLRLVGARSPTPVDINDRGQIVGLYLDRSGASHGFVLTENRYTTISAPGAWATVPTGIDDRGAVVGYTADDVELAAAHGFRRQAGRGGRVRYTAIDVPDAPRSLPLGTNDRGDIVGLNERPADTPEPPEAAAGAGPHATDRPPSEPMMPNAEQMPGMSALDLTTVRGITVSSAIADNLDALLAAAEADGFAFTGGGYRDTARQIELRRQNCGTSYYAIYEMPSSSCSPPTARPGTSNHERGLAIDFNCAGELVRSRSKPCFRWLAAHAADYGFYNLPAEPWHWSIDGA
jgi:probable HAF family extracellular repeat protein